MSKIFQFGQVPVLKDEKVVVATHGASFNYSDIAVPEALNASCSENDFAKLIDAIKSDQQYWALRSWSPQNGIGGHLHFPGLDEELLSTAFRGRKTFIYGDSTLENMYFWLEILFTSQDPSLLKRISTMNLRDANEAVVQSTSNCKLDNNSSQLICEGNTHAWGKGKNTKLNDGTEIHMQRGPKFDSNECPTFQATFDFIKSFRPHTVIVNMGLWYLHFQKRGRNRSSCVAETWISYEQFYEDTITAAEEAGVEVIVFKTTNFICAEKYRDKFATADRLYTAKDNAATINACFGNIRAEINRDISDDDVMDYCKHGVFNDIGSSYLNQRLFRFVETKRLSTSLKITVLNDHDIQSCSYTSVLDGRHYHALVLARIRMLGNLLSCAFSSQIEDDR